MVAAATGLDRSQLLQRFGSIRRRTRAFFDALEPCWDARPIPLRNPVAFYEGHLAAFAVNTLLKLGLGAAGIRPDFERLYARGIDPEDESALPPGLAAWPRRKEVLAYADEADEAIRHALAHAELVRDDRPALRGGEAVFTVLEHELMHHETLLYMARELPLSTRQALAGAPPETGGEPPVREVVAIPPGSVTLGRERGSGFGWDNELPARVVSVPGFAIDAHDVTNAGFLEFVEAGGYERPELWSPEGWDWRERAERMLPQLWVRKDGVLFWRGMAGDLPLPLAWPAWVTGVEAAAYARWRGQRLPSEAELQRAAFTTPEGGEGEEREHPWGDEPPDDTRGRFDFLSCDPVPAGSRPRGASAWGVHDLVGNGWEWSWTPFEPFPGFTPMASYPEYSADFFDGKHWVLKGASPATDAALLRRSLRNWFRPTYPWVWASFRCVTPFA